MISIFIRNSKVCYQLDFSERFLDTFFYSRSERWIVDHPDTNNLDKTVIERNTSEQKFWS